MSGVAVVVCERDMSIAEMLPRLGEGAPIALAEGRVFVGALRVDSATRLVRRGEQVTVYPARAQAGDSVRVLMRRGGLVAAYKPPAIATIADHRGRAGTLAAQVAELTGVPFERLHPSSRLDVGVSGVVLFAADAETQKQLAEAREQGAYARHYVAIASRPPEPPAGSWVAPIGRDRDPRKRRVGGRESTSAHTEYRTAAITARAALLAVEPVTGRTHQIRVHAAHAGSALWGDATYGGPTRLVSAQGSVQACSRIALHAAWVEVMLGGERVRVEAPLPSELAAWWEAVGGNPVGWEAALLPILMSSGEPAR